MFSERGRPLKFKSITELQKAIDAYFTDCDPHPIEEPYVKYPKNSKGAYDYDAEPEITTRTVISKQIPYTITGLALALETSRDVLLDYESGKYDETAEDFDELKKKWNDQVDDFSNTIKKAKLRIHNYSERRLESGQPTGTIFSLKNNFGWKDRTETDLTSGGKPLGATIRFEENPPPED